MKEKKKKSSITVLALEFKKNLNSAKHPEQPKGLGGNIGCKDKNYIIRILLYVWRAPRTTMVDPKVSPKISILRTCF